VLLLNINYIFVANNIMHAIVHVLMYLIILLKENDGIYVVYVL